MFKKFIFNTFDASRSCRAYLGIDSQSSTNGESMTVTVCFHRIKKTEPISMSYMGGIVIKKGLPHWHEFKIMLTEAMARKEASDDSLVVGAMRTYA